MEPEAPRLGRVDTDGAGGLGWDVRVLRERRVRRSGMMEDCVEGCFRNVEYKRLDVVQKEEYQI